MSVKTCNTAKPESRNLDFILHIPDNKWKNEQVTNVLLCDVRRELKSLNAVIVKSVSIAREQLRVLKGIRKNTYKRRRVKKKL